MNAREFTAQHTGEWTDNDCDALQNLVRMDALTDPAEPPDQTTETPAA